ncbi:MAG TPA: FdtA/QdtA family cupin domain-containing protein [Anaerolineaceae bacterium]|nr:FdtA/QdtA family cupin domain-containing protein [Anaerolineaceae bacterium]HPN52535.1 FdtA/QdtA family cupin domain-containing protein [Anaerolineaceae bacterium]
MSNCPLIQLPKIIDPRGNLTFIESYKHIPFEIKRIYYIFDVFGGESIDGYACLKNESLIIALSGSFDVVLDDGNKKSKYHLNRPDFGLLIPPLHWCEVDNFSTNSLALIVSSMEFDESDYIRHHDKFVECLRMMSCYE